MQKEFDELGLDVQIVGVNENGYDSANDTMTNGRDIPWLQDDGSTDAWGLWRVRYRDVVIVDVDSQYVDTFNVSNSDLGDSENYEELMDMILAVAP